MYIGRDGTIPMSFFKAEDLPEGSFYEIHPTPPRGGLTLWELWTRQGWACGLFSQYVPMG